VLFRSHLDRAGLLGGRTLASKEQTSLKVPLDPENSRDYVERLL
jgi:hypothetical protein